MTNTATAQPRTHDRQTYRLQNANQSSSDGSAIPFTAETILKQCAPGWAIGCQFTADEAAIIRRSQD
jgi:hypothetical protein